MISCDPSDLIASARCFYRCQTGRLEDGVSIYLLCSWANGGAPILQDPPVPDEVFANRVDPQNAIAGASDFMAGDGVSQINVYRSFTLGGPYTLVGSFNPAATNHYADATLTEQDNAYYMMRSVGDGIQYNAVESNDSSESCAVMPPTNLQATQHSTTANVRWDYTAPPPYQGWQVQYGTDPTFNIYANDAVPTGSDPYNKDLPFPSQPALTPSTQYYFRVRGLNPGICNTPWAVVGFVTEEP